MYLAPACPQSLLWRGSHRDDDDEVEVEEDDYIGLRK